MQLTPQGDAKRPSPVGMLAGLEDSCGPLPGLKMWGTEGLFGLQPIFTLNPNFLRLLESCFVPV